MSLNREIARLPIFALALVACGPSSSGTNPFVGTSQGMMDVLDSSAPMGAAGWFGGSLSNDDGTPIVVYPLSGSMLARNISDMNVQWTGVGSASAYRIRIKSPAEDLSFYVGASLCSKQQCSYAVPSANWLTFSQASSGEVATMAVYASSGEGSDVQLSSPLKINFSPEDVQGGLYYFSTSKGGLLRLPFGASSATFFEGIGSTPTMDNSNRCIGCHAISHDGTKVAAEVGGGDGQLGIVGSSTATPQPILPTSSVYPSNFSSFNPDGTLLLTNWAGALAVIDTTTGAVKYNVPSTYTQGRAVMPEWSPDGQTIVFVHIPPGGGLFPDVSDPSFESPAGDWLISDAGDIAVMPYNNGLFGSMTILVQSTDNEFNYYPSFSPDSQWIVFSTGTKLGSDSPIAYATVANGGYGISRDHFVSYDQKTSRLRLVATGGSAPIELTNATAGPNLTASWPKFAPFQQADNRFVFVTFSSKANYGFVVTSNVQPQIWMAAIDLTLADRTNIDPSYAPFWLPFQDPTTNNHETIWTQKLACMSNTDCGDANFTCSNGQCVGAIQ